MTPTETAARAAALGPWFHNMDLAGVATAPDHLLGDYPRVKWRYTADTIPANLSALSVLDIGCNGGVYAIEMSRRGARRVVAIGTDERYLAQACSAAEVTSAAIEFGKLSVYDVGRLGKRFDIVLFMGVLYHLRHPLLAPDLIHAHVVADRVVFRSLQRAKRRIAPVAQDYPFADVTPFAEAGFPRLHVVEHCYAGDTTNWWIPNRACTEAMLRNAGFAIAARPEEETYLCRRVAAPAGIGPVYPSPGAQT